MRANYYLLIFLCCAVSACNPAPASLVGNTSVMAISTASPDGAQSEFTEDKITRDVIGHMVEIPNDQDNSAPAEWTFQADEFRKAEVLERNVTPTMAIITVYMMTHDNPDAGDDPVTVSGKLRLSYKRIGTGWVLMTIENLTFRAIEGVST